MATTIDHLTDLELRTLGSRIDGVLRARAVERRKAEAEQRIGKCYRTLEPLDSPYSYVLIIGTLPFGRYRFLGLRDGDYVATAPGVCEDTMDWAEFKDFDEITRERFDVELRTLLDLLKAAYLCEQPEPGGGS